MLSQQLRLSTPLLLACVGLAGCGRSDRVVVHPVEGTLTINGQPLAGTQIVFHPKALADKQGPTARALTDAGGNFKLTTYHAQDGAPEGQYAVTVQLYQCVPHDDGFVPGPNLLPPKYALPATTDITAQITRGANRLAPLNVRR